MAENNHEQDDSQKTQDPTPKRLEDAKKKGEVAYSREVMHWIIIGTMAIIILSLLPKPVKNLFGYLKVYIEQPHVFPTAPSELGAHLQHIGIETLKTLSVPFASLIGMILLVGFFQTRFVISLNSIKPKLEKVSIPKGFKKLFSKKAMIDFIKNLLKVAGLSIFVIYIIKDEFRSIERWTVISPLDFLHIVQHIVFKVFIAILSVMLVISILDFVYERFNFMKRLRMSRKDVQDEHKESEGNPQVKSKIRQIRQARARKSMMSAVPKATVVVTNPTHYAVALIYEEDTMDAPKVVAKGRDYIALKIREIAQEHKIPIVENPPLARALFNTVNLDEEIPYDQYQAVSEIIRFVMELKKKPFQ